MNFTLLVSRLLCLSTISLAAISIPLTADEQPYQPTTYEAWWDYCLENTVSMNKFATWLGDVDALSRCSMRKHIYSKKYESILDVPCGLCIDFFGLEKDNIKIKYFGLDTSQKLTTRAHGLGINVVQGSIENIPYESSKFDVAYSRHILEHLPYYEAAINELIRVAKKEVLVVFFIRPTFDDIINYEKVDGHMIYHNHYDRQKLQNFVTSNKKVRSIAWEPITQQEEILHIYLADDNSK